MEVISHLYLTTDGNKSQISHMSVQVSAGSQRKYTHDSL